MYKISSAPKSAVCSLCGIVRKVEGLVRVGRRAKETRVTGTLTHIKISSILRSMCMVLEL